MSEVTVLEKQIVQIRLLPAHTAEERKRNIVANVVVEGNPAVMPFIDDAITASSASGLQLEAGPSKAGDEQKPRLRYFAVGPSTYRLRCPLCRQHGNAAVMRAAGYKDATCCLSLLSLFFPIFWLCCVCTWCGCNREWTTKGVYCDRCGGKVGVQRKAK